MRPDSPIGRGRRLKIAPVWVRVPLGPLQTDKALSTDAKLFLLPPSRGQAILASLRVPPFLPKGEFMLDLYQQLKSQVEAIEDDLRKAAGGNKAAGTRVRKSLQDVKATAQDLRKRVLEDRDASSDAGSSF